MSLKKYQLILGFAFLFAIAISMVCASVPAAAAVEKNEANVTPLEEPAVAIVGKNYDGNGNSLNLGLLQLGDIVAVAGVKMGDSLLPGTFSHTAIYVGGGIIAEAMPEGVRQSYTSIIHGASGARIERVSTTSAVKQAAVNHNNAQVGKPYDWIWLTYYGNKNAYSSSWYCSELNWAGYYLNGKDIDKNPGWSWTYGYNCAPQEIVDDADTYFVAESW